MKKDKDTPEAKARQIERELIAVSNAVYEAVYEMIDKYETRGYNSHQRAQSICEKVKGECREWINSQPKKESP